MHRKWEILSITQKVKALKRGLEGGCYLDFHVFLIGFIGSTFSNETIRRSQGDA